MSRRFQRLVILLLFALVAPACMASQFTFTNGDFKLTVPDGWPRIMQSSGDPETMVFQAPDPAPGDQNALARITVTSQRVRNLVAFQQFVSEKTNHAHALSGFKADKQRSTPTNAYYTANEGAVQQTYVEHYAFHNGFAIMVRCVRPSHSQAGRAWMTRFDKGCSGVVADLH